MRLQKRLGAAMTKLPPLRVRDFVEKLKLSIDFESPIVEASFSKTVMGIRYIGQMKNSLPFGFGRVIACMAGKDQVGTMVWRV